MPYAHPIPANEHAEAEIEIENTKAFLGFDEIVAKALAARQVYNRQLRWIDQEEYVARQLPLVRRKVNSMLVRVICSENSTDFHEMKSSSVINYIPENEVKSAVRRLVDSVYDGTNTHNKIKRQVATGCVIAICAVVNSTEFV